MTDNIVNLRRNTRNKRNSTSEPSIIQITWAMVKSESAEIIWKFFSGLYTFRNRINEGLASGGREFNRVSISSSNNIPWYGFKLCKHLHIENRISIRGFQFGYPRDSFYLSISSGPMEKLGICTEWAFWVRQKLTSIQSLSRKCTIPLVHRFSYTNFIFLAREHRSRIISKELWLLSAPSSGLQKAIKIISLCSNINLIDLLEY